MTNKPTARVGFVVPEGLWRGGRNYLRNLFSAIASVPGNPINPVLIAGHGTDLAADFPQVEVLRTSVLDRKSSAWFARKFITKLSGQDPFLQHILRKHDISTLSHCMTMEGEIAETTLAWIPDFQHIHLPHFFSEQERNQRSRNFSQLCDRCDRVIVSSECARADLHAFSPHNSEKAALLHFVADPANLNSSTNLVRLKEKYNFDGPYFFVPNQFWSHKNHRVVVTALQILKQRDKSLLVLASGSTEDPRDSSFFPSLMRYVEECDVLGCFRVLGIIPFDDLVELMRNSIAVINPSKFEGWSTSVEESKSMGKQVVLSDIPVHREQAPERGIYFLPDDPAALADAMLRAIYKFDPHDDLVLQNEARACFPERLRKFGEVYCQIIASVNHSA